MKENYYNNTVFAKDGIELSYLLTEFVDKCGGFSKLKDLTSFDMIQKYILPFTNDKRCSYVELIRGNHCKHVGKPNIYLIYPSDSKIVDVLELLKFNYGSGEELYIWFDLFCYNQHIPLTLTKDWWNHSLKPIFEGLTEVALFYFLDETVSSPFQRTWCLFESFTAKVLNIPFHIIMKPEDKHLFFNEIRKGEYNEIFLSGIDLLNSETSVFEEKNQLVNICSEIWTVKQVNEGVLSLIQDWSISLGKELISSSFQFTPEESINIHSLIGKVFIEQKKYQESLFFYEKCFVYQKQILPMNEEKMLQLMKQLISLYANLQKYFQAECLTKELITILKNRQNPDDNDNDNEILFGHIYSLGQFYEFQGKFVDAENCYKDVYQFKKKGLLGESQKYNQIETKEPNLLDLMNALGNVYANQGKFILAEQFYSKCYRKRQELFGEDHPKTLSALTNLALVNADLGKLDQALEYFDLVLEKFKTQLGESHPDTLACMANQAGIHVQLENYDLACHLYEIILVKRRELLKNRIIRSHEHENDDHFDFDVLQSMNDLAVVYTYQQKYSQAESLYQECYEKLLNFYHHHHHHHHHRPEEEEQYQQHQEHYHPQLLAAIHNLGYLYEIQEIYEKSCNYYSLCYEKSVMTLGKDHPKTLASLFHYAKVLYHLKEYEHAQNLFEECLFRRKKYYRHITTGHRQQEDQQNGSANNSVDPLMFLQQQKESSSHFHPQEDEEEQEQQSLLHIGEKDEEDDDHQQENKAIETHPDIQATKNYLILIYQKLQKFSKAKELCESSLILKGANASSIINGSRSILEGHGEEGGGGGGGNETMNGEELISNSIILSNLANIEFMEGNYSKAESFLQESYDNRKETLGENHPITISAMNTLAHFYNSTQFDLDKAKELYEKTLKQMKGAVPGAHSAHSAHPSQLLTTPSFEHHKDQQNNIILSPRTDGNTHHHNNMTAAAAHHSYSHSHAMVLQHHQNTILSTMNNLATIYLSEGNYSQAESYLFQSYEQMKAIYSEKHPNTLSILNNIGNFYYQQKQFQQAFHYYQQCYCYRKEILGEEHEDTLQSLNNLGNLYQIYFQNYQQAKICYEKCYFLRLKKHSTATAAQSSSSTASVGGNESIGSAISLETLTSMNNLGVLYILLKEFWHAKELLMKCFHLRQELLGIDHLDTLMTLNNVASVLVYLEEYPQAKEFYELCLSERIKKYSFLKEIKKKQNLQKEEEEIASVRKNLEFVEKKLLE